MQIGTMVEYKSSASYTLGVISKITKDNKRTVIWLSHPVDVGYITTDCLKANLKILAKASKLTSLLFMV